jgi:hypothetical protein
MASEVLKNLDKDASQDATGKLYDILRDATILSTALEHFTTKRLIEEITHANNKEEIIKNVLELFKFYNDYEVKNAIKDIDEKARKLLEIFKENE